jgi:hypothetical protein
VPGGDDQMRRRPSEEAQLERDYQARNEARDSDKLAKATARAQAKGKMR